MEKAYSHITYSGTSTSVMTTVQNTSCTGGTVTEVSIPSTDGNDGSVAYILTIKELRTFNGFESINNEQAKEVIQALSQLSALCYNAILNE